MSDPKYRPRDYCDPPGYFGLVDTARFAVPAGAGTGTDEVSRRRHRALMFAAQYQHEIALEIRRLMRERGMVPKQFIADGANDYKVTRLSRLLNGRIVMHLDDIAAAELVFGERLERRPLPARPSAEPAEVSKAPEPPVPPEAKRSVSSPPPPVSSLRGAAQQKRP